MSIWINLNYQMTIRDEYNFVWWQIRPNLSICVCLEDFNLLKWWIINNQQIGYVIASRHWIYIMIIIGHVTFDKFVWYLSSWTMNKLIPLQNLMLSISQLIGQSLLERLIRVEKINESYNICHRFKFNNLFTQDSKIDSSNQT